MGISVNKLHAAFLSSLLAGLHLAAWAEQPATQNQNSATDKSRFELSAMVIAKPTLSRSEIDPSAVAAPARLQQAAPQAALPSVSLPASPSSLTKGQPLEPQPDLGYLKEYNVDWSSWITAQADHWYYTLQAAETLFGLHFMSERPAIIEFTCFANGTIGNITVKQSSGIPAYDRLQLATLLASTPTKPFPPGTHRNSITLSEGWESHPKQPGEIDYQPGSFGKNFPQERVQKWVAGQ